MKLWKCPKCGIIGRLMHRYLAPFPKPTGPDDPGKCCEDKRGLDYILYRQKLRFAGRDMT